MPLAAARHATYAEYLALEALQGERNEYYQGVILAMAGGTVPHAILKTNLTGLVFAQLKGRLCRAYDADLRIRVAETTLATYPDLSIICGAPEVDAADPHAATNPTALFEVLSPSTSAYDRGQKFENYRRIATLRHYVLVESERIHVEVFSLNASGHWELTEFNAGDTLVLPQVDVSVPLDELYEGWAASA